MQATDERGGRITAHALTKRFGSVEAVSDLSFTASPGVVTGFLGPNGSGKTTTLRMVLGLVAPTAGEARIGGARFCDLEQPARAVGAVLDAQGFHPGRAARAHLRAHAAAIGLPDGRADEVLELVGLTDAARRPVGGFSLGMRQRLSLATALLADPQTLVLDEPGNGLDPAGVAWLRSFLRGFAGSGRTVLFSSHLLAEVEQTADHLVVISHGRSVYQGGLDQLRASSRSRVLVRCASPARLAEELARGGLLELDTLPDGRLAVGGADPVKVGDAALAAGVAVYGLVEERADLEQLFFQLTGAGSAAAQDPGVHPAAR
ncbi:ATP-binding cassette domain-containing protein [Pseudonocardia bannensis]|uniref:ATP-binding cassette domain-containing protein n=1 Tax=Pseudonocardia bannensis TaxID=630973 RepID=A0A848DL78_9PSEU|nr:ATP-binding cassette domain-containing protein [Pseudonocardia bannensis]NMH93289.1 ATP-binding cassette domain-containing protein [Pseudonocardia bannensis]